MQKEENTKETKTELNYLSDDLSKYYIEEFESSVMYSLILIEVMSYLKKENVVFGKINLDVSEKNEIIEVILDIKTNLDEINRNIIEKVWGFIEVFKFPAIVRFRLNSNEEEDVEKATVVENTVSTLVKFGDAEIKDHSYLINFKGVFIPVGSNNGKERLECGVLISTKKVAEPSEADTKNFEILIKKLKECYFFADFEENI